MGKHGLSLTKDSNIQFSDYDENLTNESISIDDQCKGDKQKKSSNDEKMGNLFLLETKSYIEYSIIQSPNRRGKVKIDEVKLEKTKVAEQNFPKTKVIFFLIFSLRKIQKNLLGFSIREILSPSSSYRIM